MAIYKCSVCGAIYDEAKEGKPLSELPCCPICKQPVSKFVLVPEESRKEPVKTYEGESSDGSYWTIHWRCNEHADVDARMG